MVAHQGFRRFRVPVADGLDDGQVFPLGLDAGPGASAWFQYWYRDPLAGPGASGAALSNAIRLDFQ